jgi:putative FmdB family regulatory protein
MPLYEYVCLECGNKFDALRSIKDADEPIACTRCGCEKSTRQVSLFFASSGGRPVAGTASSGCAGCSGGSCATCH